MVREKVNKQEVIDEHKAEVEELKAELDKAENERDKAEREKELLQEQVEHLTGEQAVEYRKLLEEILDIALALVGVKEHPTLANCGALLNGMYERSSRADQLRHFLRQWGGAS